MVESSMMSRVIGVVLAVPFHLASRCRRKPRGTLGFKSGDVCFVTQRNADVIKAFHQTPANVVVNLKGSYPIKPAHFTLFQIHDNTQRRISIHRGPQGFDIGLINHGRQQSHLARVATEDVSKPR